MTHKYDSLKTLSVTTLLKFICIKYFTYLKPEVVTSGPVIFPKIINVAIKMYYTIY